MTTTMQAAIWHGRKDLRVQEWKQPGVGPGFVLVRVRRAGICGSDLHYFEHGYCGSFRPTGPFVLGHELCGVVERLGEGVTEVARGDRVVVNPARACGVCEYCRAGRGNLCRHTVMLGSASTTPSTDGAFAEWVAVRAEQCHLLPPEMDEGLGALMEPLAVAVHAIKRAGGVAGRRVLVVGGGPIGVLVMLAARAYGAVPVVLSDVLAGRRSCAMALGADAVLDPAEVDLPDRVRQWAGDGFDVIFEASGVPAALRQAITLARPGATLVQIGTLPPGDVALALNQIMARELQYVGSFRYGNVFDECIRLTQTGRVALGTLVSQVFPLEAMNEAMAAAAGRDGVLKVQIQLP
jgi:L-idonate 5-dehydrogenase